MKSATFKPILVWVCAMICFVVALLLFVAASWLCAEGSLPSVPVGDRTYVAVAGLSINGITMPAWAFYFLPSALFLLAVALVFVGWRLVRPSR
jgi:hypothetical protein